MANQAQLSSRLCVKGIPKYLKEERLRDLFAEQGEVTDVKILRMPDGRSRQMAFVGYKSNTVASRAQKYFDRSFIDTSKLNVTIALPFGDKSLNSKAWSKYTKAKLARQQEKEERLKSTSSVDVNTKPQQKPVDKRLEEFLAANQSRGKAQFWANDDVATMQVDDSNNNNSGPSKTAKQEKKETESDSDSSESSDSDNESVVNEPSAIVESESAKLAKSKKVSDKEYMKSLMTTGSDSESSDSESDDDSSSSSSDSNSSSDEGEETESKTENKETNSGDKPETKQSREYEDVEEDVSESGRLFIRNIPFSTTEDELRSLFESYGPVAEVHIPLNHSKQSRGIGYVLFMIPEDAVKAMSSVDGTIFQGRLLHVLPAMSKPKDPKEEESGKVEETAGYKAKLEAKRKEKAGDDTNWSALFTRADAAAGAVAKQLGLSKGELLDDTMDVADSLAVRVALSETQIIAESKQFLKDHGVDLDALQLALEKGTTIERSDVVLFVKNLPENSQETELRQMFGKFGALERLVMPPSRTMALIVFYEPKIAKKAFQSMAYKRYKRAPLYLEWAPKGTITSIGTQNNGAEDGDESKTGDETKLDDNARSNMVVQDRVVFFKNLSFEATEDSITKFIEKLAGKKSIVAHITIPRKKRTRKDGTVEELSMGYGFIEMVSDDAARRVVRTCDGKEMDGRLIEAKLSTRPKAMVAPVPKSATGEASASKSKMVENKGVTKIVVRNLPFEATKKELRRLFSAYGQVNSVRVPKKFDGSHRGFAFVDFVTHQEAKAAFSSLASTHLYGRHLVLEWAEDENSIETLRRKAAADLDTAQVANEKEASRKRIRLDEDSSSDADSD